MFQNVNSYTGLHLLQQERIEQAQKDNLSRNEPDYQPTEVERQPVVRSLVHALGHSFIVVGNRMEQFAQ